MFKFKCLLVLVVAALFGAGCDSGSVPGDDGSPSADTSSVDLLHPPCEVTVHMSLSAAIVDPCETAGLGRCTSEEIAQAALHPLQAETTFKGVCQNGCLIQTMATDSAPAMDVIVSLNTPCSTVNPQVRGICLEAAPMPRTESSTIFFCVD